MSEVGAMGGLEPRTHGQGPGPSSKNVVKNTIVP
jgi:hypothetical protein